MFTAVNAAAQVLNPLSTSISNGIMRSIEAMTTMLSRRKNNKIANDLAYSLQIEYPHESRDYVMNLAINLLKEKSK